MATIMSMGPNPELSRNELSGRELARSKSEVLGRHVAQMREVGAMPRLAIVYVPTRPVNLQSKTYIGLKVEEGQSLGVEVGVVRVKPRHKQVLEVIDRLNTDNSVHGIIVQLPLPGQLDDPNIVAQVLNHVRPSKDVDGLGRSGAYQPASRRGYKTAGPAGVMALLEANNIKVRDQRVAVIGHGRTMGAPLVVLLKEAGAQVKTYFLPDRPINVAEICNCDIVVGATDSPYPVITSEMVKDGAVVIDATGKQVDDEVRNNPSVRTSPSTGGVGPLTVVGLFENVVKATLAFHWSKSSLQPLHKFYS